MDAKHEVQQALAHHGLVWADIWKVTVDCRERLIVLITLDGRKFTHPLAEPQPKRTRATLVKTAAAPREG